MASCTVCLKYVLFAFNLAMAMLGVALLGVGVWLSVDEGGQKQVMALTEHQDDQYMLEYTDVDSTSDANTVAVHLAYGLIALGALLCVSVMVGCWGAHRESSGLLTLYAILLFCLMVTLVGVGIWAQQQKDDIDDLYRGGSGKKDQQLLFHTDSNIHHAINDYRSKAEAQAFVDALQQKFSCCGGRRRYLDWGDVTKRQGSGSNFQRFNPPQSCKLLDSQVQRDCNTTVAEWYPQSHHFHGNRPRNQQSYCVYRTGCSNDYYWTAANEIRAFLDERYSTIVGMCLGVAVCLGFGLIFTIMLCCILRRSTVITVN